MKDTTYNDALRAYNRNVYWNREDAYALGIIFLKQDESKTTSHINENKYDNSIENLKLVDEKKQMNRQEIICLGMIHHYVLHQGYSMEEATWLYDAIRVK